MDFGQLVQLIIGRFKTSGGYTDLTDDELSMRLEVALKEKYNQEIGVASIIMDQITREDGYHDKDKYHKAVRDVENKVVESAIAFAATTKVDLQDLIKSS